MGLTTIYSIFDAETGEQIFTGTVNECADKLGVTAKTFKQLLTKEPYETGLDIQTYPPMSEHTASFVRAWDAMCIPLRKKFGVKVKRMEEKDNA